MSSPLSLQGLSGYDFSGIVSQMVEVYRMPEYQMQKTQNNFKVEKDAWREINTRLSALNNSLLNLRLSSTWTAAKASSSNETMLSATASASAIQGNYNIKIINAAQAQTVVSSIQAVSDTSAATTVSAGSFNIAIGTETKTVDIAAGDSLSTIAQKINSAKAGVTASVVQVAGGYRLAITSNQTGLSNAAAFSNVTGTVLQDLGLVDGANVLNISQQAMDAKISVNGIQDITSSTNSITTAIPGVTLNLKGSDNGASTINLTVSPDNSVAEKAVQDFIDKYNSAIDYIASKLSYDKDTKKTGDLFGDPILQGIQARLRRIVTGELNNPTGPYFSLSLIGIKTVSATDGKLVFDTNKFNEAMGKNPESIANLFGAPAGGVTPSTDPATAQGLSNLLDAYLDPMIKYGGSISQKQDSLDQQIRDISKRIDAFEARVANYEEMLNRRFSSLETMLSQLNQQSSWLSSQTAMMSNSSKSK